MRIIHIAASTSYDVILDEGVLARAGETCAAALPPRRVMVVSDATVFALFGDTVTQSFERAGYAASAFTFEPGEHSKTMTTLALLLNELARRGFTRGDCVAALGGGVTGDLAGFASAAYARGIPFIQLPTTLLAAVDSSVGGKTAVNLDAGKNLAGAFWQPSLVLCDVDVMRRLPPHLKSEGAAEMIKHAVLADPILFARLADDDEFTQSSQLEDTLERNIHIKRAHVESDERDVGLRQKLNLGHTIAHAIETASRHEYTHGQAVAIGLYRVTRAAESMGLCRAGLSGDIARALTAHNLPRNCAIHPDELLKAAALDKKRQGRMTTLVVPLDIGECALRRVDDDELARWFRMGAQ